MYSDSSYKDEIFALNLGLQSVVESLQEIITEISVNPKITPATIRNLVKNPLYVLKEITGESSSMPSVEFKQNNLPNPQPPSNIRNQPGASNPNIEKGPGRLAIGGKKNHSKQNFKVPYEEPNIKPYFNPNQDLYKNGENMQMFGNFGPGNEGHHYLGNPLDHVMPQNQAPNKMKQPDRQQIEFNPFNLFSSSGNNGGLFNGNENELRNGLAFFQGLLNPCNMDMSGSGMNNPKPQPNSSSRKQPPQNRPIQLNPAQNPQPRNQVNPNIPPGNQPAQLNPLNPNPVPIHYSQSHNFGVSSNPPNLSAPPPLIRRPSSQLNPSNPSNPVNPVNPSNPANPANQAPRPSKRKNFTMEELKSLGTTTYKIRDPETRAECSICLNEYTVNDQISFINCTHFFHTGCLKDWLIKKNECPTCNAEVLIE